MNGVIDTQKGYIMSKVGGHLLGRSLLFGAALLAPRLVYAQLGDPHVYGSAGDDFIVVGCVDPDGAGYPRAWACINGQPGDDYQLMDTYNCTMNETYIIETYGGADRINIVHSTGNQSCGGQTLQWSPLSHAGHEIDVWAGSGDDTVYGDNGTGSLSCYVRGGDDDDSLYAWGPYPLYGDYGDDNLFTYSTSTHDRLYGSYGDDCLADYGTAGCDNMDCGEGGESGGDYGVDLASCNEQNCEHLVAYCW